MSLSANFNLNALKDTYDESCFLARLDKTLHLMTQWPPASAAGSTPTCNELSPAPSPTTAASKYRACGNFLTRYG
jgi:hypothetical protein